MRAQTLAIEDNHTHSSTDFFERIVIFFDSLVVLTNTPFERFTG